MPLLYSDEKESHKTAVQCNKQCSFSCALIFKYRRTDAFQSSKTHLTVAVVQWISHWHISPCSPCDSCYLLFELTDIACLRPSTIFIAAAG